MQPPNTERACAATTSLQGTYQLPDFSVGGTPEWYRDLLNSGAYE